MLSQQGDLPKQEQAIWSGLNEQNNAAKCSLGQVDWEDDGDTDTWAMTTHANL